MTEEAALAAFVAGTISFAALRNALSGSTTFVFQPNGTVYISCPQPLPLTHIRPDDVRHALIRYQNGELAVEELAIWGMVLYNLDCFELKGATESVEDEVWDVIGQLSLASVNDAFDNKRVSDLLKRISGIV